MVEQDARNLNARHGVVRIKSRLVAAYMILPQRREALAIQRDAIRLVEELVKASPENLMYRQSLGTAHGQLGMLHEAGKEMGPAETHIGTAVTIYEALIEEDPGNAQYRRELLVAWGKAGDLRLALNDRETCRRYYERGLIVAEQQFKNDPRDAQALTDLIIQYLRLGQHAYFDGRPGDARKRMEEALKLLDLMDKQKMYKNAMVGLPRAFEIKLILSMCDKASKSIAQPGYAQKQWFLAQPMLLQRILGLCRQGKHQEATVTVEQLRQQGPRNRQVLLDVARGYGRCAATVLGKKKPNERTAAERTALEEYRAKALTALEECIKQGFDEPQRLAADSDLAVLREEAKFRQLAEQLRKKKASQ
jgi:tetratricopeptide (TPR) repeat protein